MKIRIQMMKNNRSAGLLGLAVLMLSLSCCQSPGPYLMKGTSAPNHASWNALLIEHVSADGRVDYAGFQQDIQLLEAYLEELNVQAPDTDVWSEAEQLAFWINAYNAFTVKLIVDHYPVQSIQDLHPFPYIPLLRTVWHKPLFRIANRAISLDHIEHGILRKEFDEPRIHFAINCASASCPPLMPKAYVAEDLDSQLDQAARNFLRNRQYNQLSEHEAQLSKIFSWFRSDFTKEGSLIDFLNKYAEPQLSPMAKINFLPYDWSLNE